MENKRTRDKHLGESSHLEEEHKEGWERKVGEAGKAQLRKLRDGNTKPPDLPLEKHVYRLGSNSKNWPWNKRLVPNWKRSTSRLYIVTLLI